MQRYPTLIVEMNVAQSHKQSNSFPASTGQDSCRRAVRIVDIDHFDLGAAGHEKNGANGHPGYECQRVMLRNAMSIGEGSAMEFVQRPVSLILILVVVAVLVLPRLARRWSARCLPA